MTKLNDIKQLKPAPYNPRKISDSAAKGLHKSIELFGDVAGITWNKRTGHLVTGHQRVNQLRKAGGVLKDDKIVLPSGESFAVRVVDWGEGQEKAANVAANNHLISGTFADDLNDILAEIESSVSEIDFAELQFDALGSITELVDPVITRPEGEAAGASPWSRMAASADGVILQCGDLTLKVPNNLASKLSAWADKTHDWQVTFIDKLEELCRG